MKNRGSRDSGIPRQFVASPPAVVCVRTIHSERRRSQGLGYDSFRKQAGQRPSRSAFLTRRRSEGESTNPSPPPSNRAASHTGAVKKTGTGSRGPHRSLLESANTPRRECLSQRFFTAPWGRGAQALACAGHNMLCCAPRPSRSCAPSATCGAQILILSGRFLIAPKGGGHPRAGHKPVAGTIDCPISANCCHTPLLCHYLAPPSMPQRPRYQSGHSIQNLISTMFSKD